MSGLGRWPPGSGCIVPEVIEGCAGEGPKFAAGNSPPLLSWRFGHGEALAQCVPWNLFRVYYVGEKVRGETEVGVEVSAGHQAPFGVGLPHLLDVSQSVNHPVRLFRVAEEVARVRDQSPGDVLQAGLANRGLCTEGGRGYVNLGGSGMGGRIQLGSNRGRTNEEGFFG